MPVLLLRIKFLSNECWMRSSGVFIIRTKYHLQKLRTIFFQPKFDMWLYGLFSHFSHNTGKILNRRAPNIMHFVLWLQTFRSHEWTTESIWNCMLTVYRHVQLQFTLLVEVGCAINRDFMVSIPIFACGDLVGWRCANKCFLLLISNLGLWTQWLQ